MQPPVPAGDDGGGPGSPDVEARLVARFQAYLAAGPNARADPALAGAWDDFSLAFEPMIRAHAAERAGLERDDAKQEAWEALFACLAVYRPDPARGRFLGLAAVVVRHAITDEARRQAASRRTPPPRPRPGPVDPSAAVEHAERRERVRQALVALRAESGTMACLVVVHRWYMGKTIDEAADRLGLSCGQVRGILHRARPRLRALLADAIDLD
jgi:RNA polymerase sigma factor (sigma-70 family)